MELHDVARRILARHWRLIACLVAVGLIGAALVARATKTESFTATSRLALDTADPETRAQSEAIADTVAAIATSPAQVRSALSSAHAKNRDAVDVAAQDVSVQGLGSSGIVEIAVSDRDPRVAASVANALAEGVIRARRQITSGQLHRVLARLDSETRELNDRIAALDARSPLDVRAMSVRDSLIRQRDNLDSARATALSADAQRPKAAIVSPATPPRQADAGSSVIDIALGGLLGLIAGVGLAALLETLRPTLVGRAALAEQLDAPLLGDLRATANGDGPGVDAAGVAGRMRLAAKTAGVSKVGLVPASRELDVGGLAGGLDGPVPVEPFSATSPPAMNGTPTGFVVVSPTTLRRAELDDVIHLLRVAPGPLLGLVTYAPREKARGAAARGLVHRIAAGPRSRGRRPASS